MAEEGNNNRPLFRTISGDDWRRSIAAARKRRAEKGERIKTPNVSEVAAKGIGDILSMTPQERADKFNASGVVHADVNEDGTLSVYGDYAPGFFEAKSDGWRDLFRGGRFRTVKLELVGITDADCDWLAAAAEIENLNLNGNQHLHGALFAIVPATIGLRTLDITGTAVTDDDMRRLLKFPKLQTVWGHKGQFRDETLAEAKRLRPNLEFKLIY